MAVDGNCSRFFRIVFVVVSMLAAVFAGPPSVHGALAVGDPLGVEEILDGIAHGRGQLVSGVFSMRGKRVHVGQAGESSESDLQVDSAFCFATERAFILQRTEPVELVKLDSQSLITSVVRFTCLRPDFSMFYGSDSNMPWLNIHPPRDFRRGGGDRRTPGGVARAVGLFDVRRVGIMNSFRGAFSGENFDSEFDRFSARHRSKGYDVTHLGNGVYRMGTNSGRPRTPGSFVLNYEVIVNAQQGFTITHVSSTTGVVAENGIDVISLDEHFRDHPVDQSDRRAMKEREMMAGYQSHLDIRWQKIADTWVPVSLSEERSSQQYLSNESGELEFFTGWIDVNKHEVNFKWASVNETLGDEYFSMETVDLPSGTPIYDWRDGELMLLIGYVGDRRGSGTASRTLVFTIVAGLSVASLGFLLWRRSVSVTK